MLTHVASSYAIQFTETNKSAYMRKQFTPPTGLAWLTKIGEVLQLRNTFMVPVKSCKNDLLKEYNVEPTKMVGIKNTQGHNYVQKLIS